ncbi:T9SS type A sorting domain-containing protein [Candidatus Cloacimonadota bacterium]
MKILKVTFLLIVIVQFVILFSDIITEAVYSDSALDGEINFSQNSQSFNVNSWMYDMYSGDHCGNLFDPDLNSYVRSYLTFFLPEIPEDYHVDSAYVRIYQFESNGYNASTGDHTDFPVWDVAGGDTIQCILSHIDYGGELDVDDWAKGDVGNQFTYQNNVGTVTESGDVGYRYIDVSASVIQDYEFNRDKTQYRIAFQIDTDWEDWPDLVGFMTSSGHPYEELKPTLYITYSDEINSIEEQEIPVANKFLFNINPNPVKDRFNISFSRKDLDIEKLEIFNIKGQKVKNVSFSEFSNSNITLNCGTMPSGIYFVKVSSGIEVAVKKFLLIK